MGMADRRNMFETSCQKQQMSLQLEALSAKTKQQKHMNTPRTSGKQKMCSMMSLVENKNKSFCHTRSSPKRNAKCDMKNANSILKMVERTKFD